MQVKRVKPQKKHKLNIELCMDAIHIEMVWMMETSIYSFKLVNEAFNVSQNGKYMEAHISSIIFQMLHQTTTLTHTCYTFYNHPHHCFLMIELPFFLSFYFHLHICFLKKSFEFSS